MNQLITIAINELGYLEKSKSAYQKDPSILDSKTSGKGSDNYVKYWRGLDKGMQGQAWCNCFINWIFTKRYGDKAKEILCYPTAKSLWAYYTPTSSQYFKNRGRWFKTPQKGDIVYFENTERIHHVGLVIAVDGTMITTIEGNTSSDSYNNEGGCVAMHYYQITDKKIAGFGRPIYPSSDGWVKKANDWYYYKNGTPLKREWVLDDHKWYRLGIDGKMLTGWHQIYDASGKLRDCFFGEDGALWHEASDHQGYLEPWIVK